MRIIAGNLGGRLFAAPRGHRTHPMSDKMRGALFNMLGDISGQTVLDAFAGSGALSFEAVSRGASRVVAIESDRQAQATIQQNIADLGVAGSMHLVKAGAGAWLNTTDDIFDLVLLDPPYDRLQYDLLERLAERVAADGQLVLSWPGGQTPPELPGLALIGSKQYGDGSLHRYQR